MVIPSYGQAVVQNYRAQFKAMYNRETSLTDEDIWTIYNSIFDDSDPHAEDAERVHAMREKEEES